MMLELLILIAVLSAVSCFKFSFPVLWRSTVVRHGLQVGTSSTLALPDPLMPDITPDPKIKDMKCKCFM